MCIVTENKTKRAIDSCIKQALKFFEIIEAVPFNSKTLRLFILDAKVHIICGLLDIKTPFLYRGRKLNIESIRLASYHLREGVAHRRKFGL